MIFGYFTLFVALLIEVVGAYYSITGLAAIFSGAVVPILIMGGSLEVGKVTAAVWLKNNWHRASLQFKAYLLPAVVLLMFITSMGIFGFLSKAHNDQNLVSGDVQAKIAIYDEKIKTAQDNIAASRKQLQQMDAAVDQVMARSTNEQGANRSNEIRRSQARDRTQIAKDIEANQKLIAKLNDEAAPIRAEVRKVEAEVGPIKYIAKLIYGDNPDANLLEQAVVWVIIMIVAVFDPLALVLILAAQQSIRWAQGKDGGVVRDRDGTIVGLQPPEEEIKKSKERVEPQIEEKKTDLDLANEILKVGVTNSNPVDNVPVVEPTEDLPFKGKGTAPSVPFTAPATVNKPRVKRDIKKRQERRAKSKVEEPTPAEVVEPKPPRLDASDERPGDYLTKEPVELPPARPAQLEAAPGPNRGIMNTHLAIEADNAPKLGKASNTSFGNEYPANPEKGDVFLRTDFLPNRLFKFNGTKWIEVDKTQTDMYAYDELYIKHLIGEIEAGRYDVETLTDLEREQVAEYLAKN